MRPCIQDTKKPATVLAAGLGAVVRGCYN